MYKNRDGIVEPLDLQALANLELNDFKGMEKLLFTDEERENPNRWDKFWECDEDLGAYWTIIVPFSHEDLYLFDRPKIAYQVNHYVLWMTMAYLCADCKPSMFMSYNKAEYINEPISTCYGCGYAEVVAKIVIGGNYCDFCPIWGSINTFSACTKYYPQNGGKDGFRNWLDVKGHSEEADMLRRQFATEVATYAWTSEKEIDYEN